MPIHLNLAGQLLGVSSNNITSDTSDVNATSNGTVKSLASISDNSDNSTTQVQDSQMAALNMTVSKSKGDVTIVVGEYECTDNNYNGRCSLDKPNSKASVCDDIDQNLYCDWFKPASIRKRTVLDNGTVIEPPLVGIHPCPDPSFNGYCHWYPNGTVLWYQDTENFAGSINTTAIREQSYPPGFDPGYLQGRDLVCYTSGFYDARDKSFFNLAQFNGACGYTYFGAFINGCTANGRTRETCEATANNATEPQVQPAPAPIRTAKLQCQSNDDFCKPGCEYEDMVCLYGENDKDMNGVRDSQKNSGSNTSSFNGTTPRCIDNNLDRQCDIKWEAPPPDIGQKSQSVWMRICTSLQPALMSSCTALVNSDGTLTYEGNRAVGCIRNGALLAAAAGFNEIPLEWIIDSLQALEGPTGCSGIVNWKILNQLGSMNTILNLVQASPS